MPPRGQPGSRGTSPLPHPAPWRSRSAARPRHLGAGTMGGAYANMFTLKLGLASPLEEKCTAPAPGMEAGEGGCGSRRRVSSFCAPLLGTFTAFAPADSRLTSLTARLLDPNTACASACGSHTLRISFLHLARRNEIFGKPGSG